MRAESDLIIGLVFIIGEIDSRYSSLSLPDLHQGLAKAV
jgi:hypothetical protein